MLLTILNHRHQKTKSYKFVIFQQLFIIVDPQIIKLINTCKSYRNAMRICCLWDESVDLITRWASTYRVRDLHPGRECAYQHFNLFIALTLKN